MSGERESREESCDKCVSRGKQKGQWERKEDDAAEAREEMGCAEREWEEG